MLSLALWLRKSRIQLDFYVAHIIYVADVAMSLYDKVLLAAMCFVCRMCAYEIYMMFYSICLVSLSSLWVPYPLMNLNHGVII